MKSVVSVVLTGSLLLQVVPAGAQSWRPSTPPPSSWPRVQAIVAGSPIRAVYVGRRQDKQYFVSATDQTMTLLAPASLPRDARNTLIEIARTQPGFFTATKWMEFTTGHVRVTPDGVWRKGHRIAALEDVITTVDRGDVAEVWEETFVRRTRPMAPPGMPDPDATVGAAAGVAGGLLTFAACKDKCWSWVYVAGFVGPMLASAILLARHRDKEMDLVYRAP